jgi:hypothetical protein
LAQGLLAERRKEKPPAALNLAKTENIRADRKKR